MNVTLKKAASSVMMLGSLLTASLPVMAASSAPATEYTQREQIEYNYAYSLGVQATIYGWAPVMMDVALDLQTNVIGPTDNGQAPLNQLGPITRLWDYRDRSYTTPNNDTLYLQLWGDLEEQPMVLTVPQIDDRYWMAQIVDMYTEAVVDLSNATVGNDGGDFILAKKGYQGELPEGVPVFYSDTRYIWMAGRLGVENEADQKVARDLQEQFRITPLSQYPVTVPQPEPLNASGAPEVNFPQGLAWFDRLNKVLQENPLESDKELVDSFKFIGINNGGTENLSEVRKVALNKAFADGFAIVRDAAMYTGVPVNGWNWEYEAGRYGTDYLLRAAVNMNSIGLNSPERAMYPKRYVDNTGELLTGEHAYEVTFPADMAINEDLGGFWTVTMYDAQDRFMVENEINRYKVGSLSDHLVYNDDGSLTVYISSEKPTDSKRLANWLPAPKDGFMLQIRMYEPKPEVYQGKFELPEMYKVSK
ncbi:phosphatidylserine decarboxylase [Vibrio sp. JCM 19236]|nr:phosphatidylserine decarboxylase [Vibrio sp. JCM 19236]